MLVRPDETELIGHQDSSHTKLSRHAANQNSVVLAIDRLDVTHHACRARLVLGPLKRGCERDERLVAKVTASEPLVERPFRDASSRDGRAIRIALPDGIEHRSERSLISFSAHPTSRQSKKRLSEESLSLG